jgi:hypothetical protein
MKSPEGRSHNLDLSTLKVLPKQREPGWSIKQPATPVMENPSDKSGEQPKRPLKDRLRGILTSRRDKAEDSQRRGRKPGGQADRGAKPEPVQPNVAEQQARERLGKPPPEEVRGEVQPADDLFQTIQKLSFDQLLELKPEEYGFRHIGDMLLYLLVERGMAYFPGLYSTVEARLEQDDEFQTVMGAPPDRSTEELDRTVQRLMDEEFVHVIQELAAHWRNQGRL